MSYEPQELQQAWCEYARLGVEERDWHGWAGLFCENGVYIEHGQELTIPGRVAIQDWIAAEMRRYPALSLWIEWAIIDKDRVAFYIWNNLPALTGTTTRYAFPNTTILTYGGGGEWLSEVDHYNPDDPARVFRHWVDDGGRRDTPPDWTLQGINGWAPRSWTAPPREEVHDAFTAYAEAFQTGIRAHDWTEWLGRFDEGSRHYDHALGRISGRAALLAWTSSEAPRFGPATVTFSEPMIGADRVVSAVSYSSSSTGDSAPVQWDMCLVLQYAGEGRWGYEEAVYNPYETQRRTC